MKPADNIEKLIKDLHVLDIDTSAEMDQRIMEDALKAQKKVKETKSAETKPDIWRMIMNSKITKLAAAAVIIIAVALSITILDKSVPSAYALEQTIDAYNNIRFLHVKQFKTNQEEPLEFWIKSDEQGGITNARYYLPEHVSPEDGAKLITWTPERAELWFKRKHSYLIFQSKRIEGWMASLLEQAQPKLVLEKLLESQKTGKVDLDIQEQSEKQKPIIIFAIYKTKSKKRNLLHKPGNEFDYPY